MYDSIGARDETSPPQIPASSHRCRSRSSWEADMSEGNDALPASKPTKKEHACESVGLAAPRSIAINGPLASKSIRHATRRPTKFFVVVVGTTFVIGCCVFDRDIGHIMVACIFGIIIYTMIRGT